MTERGCKAWALLFLCGLSGLLACSGDESAAAGAGGDGSTSSSPTGTKTSATTTSPDRPDAMVLAAKQAMQDGNLAPLWESLPSSFRSDVNRIVHTFGEKVDPELYDRGLGLLGKVVGLLKSKKDFILKSAMVAPMLVASGQTPEDSAKDFDNAVAMLDKLLSSEIKSVAGLKKMDVGKYVSGSLSEALKGSMEMASEAFQQQLGYQNLMETTTEVLSEEGDTAVVRTQVPGEPASEDTFVRIEGKWIPEDLATSWKPKVDEAIASLNEMTFEEADKAQFLGIIAQVDTALDKLAAAKNQTEFDMAVAGIMQNVMGAMMGMGGPGGMGQDPYGDN